MFVIRSFLLAQAKFWKIIVNALFRISFVKEVITLFINVWPRPGEKRSSGMCEHQWWERLTVAMNNSVCNLQINKRDRSIVCQSVCLSVTVCLCLSISSSLYQSVWLSPFPFLSLSLIMLLVEMLTLSLTLSVCLSVCLSLSLSNIACLQKKLYVYGQILYQFCYVLNFEVRSWEGLLLWACPSFRPFIRILNFWELNDPKSLFYYLLMCLKPVEWMTQYRLWSGLYCFIRLVCSNT